MTDLSSIQFANLSRRQVKKSEKTSPKEKFTRLKEKLNIRRNWIYKNNMPIFKKKRSQRDLNPNVWARPEMTVIFRAEIMPGRSREERTFRIREVLPNDRVLLYDFGGEHLQNEFEPLNFQREKGK